MRRGISQEDILQQLRGRPEEGEQVLPRMRPKDVLKKDAAARRRRGPMTAHEAQR
jgi:hypothetical protein